MRNKTFKLGELSAVIAQLEKEAAAYKTLRRAICKNLIVESAPINEEGLTLNDLLALINAVGRDYEYQERQLARRGEL
ncbi:MAG: hypothetical protein GY743_23500 [Planctomycetaceae bacterium]|nr:hypothetical protein [Planctomycetaceae bacterium]